MEITAKHIENFKQKTAEEQVAFLNDRLSEIRKQFNSSISLLEGKYNKAKNSPYLNSDNPHEKQLAESKVERTLAQLDFLKTSKKECLQILIELASHSKEADFDTIRPLLSENCNFKKLYHQLNAEKLKFGAFLRKDFFQIFSLYFRPHHFEALFDYFYQQLKYKAEQNIKAKEEEFKEHEEKLNLLKNSNGVLTTDQLANIGLISYSLEDFKFQIEKEKRLFELKCCSYLFSLITFFSISDNTQLIKNIQTKYDFSDNTLSIGFLNWLFDNYFLFNDGSKDSITLNLIDLVFKLPLSEIKQELNSYGGSIQVSPIVFKANILQHINSLIGRSDKTEELKLAVIKLMNNPDFLGFFEDTMGITAVKDWQILFGNVAELGIDIPLGYTGDLMAYAEKMKNGLCNTSHPFENIPFLYFLAKDYAQANNRPHWLFDPLVKIMSHDLEGFFTFIEKSQGEKRTKFPYMSPDLYSTDFSAESFHKGLLGESKFDLFNMFNLTDLLPMALEISDSINDNLNKKLNIKFTLKEQRMVVKESYLIKEIAEKTIGSLYHHLCLIKTVEKLESKTDLTVQEQTIIDNYNSYMAFIKDFLGSFQYEDENVNEKQKQKEVKTHFLKELKENTNEFFKAFGQKINDLGE